MKAELQAEIFILERPGCLRAKDALVFRIGPALGRKWEKHQEMPVPSSRSVLLGYSGLVAHRLPAPAAAYPDAGIAIRSAEIFSELMALHVGAGGDHGGVAIDANHHVGNIHSLISQVPASARTNRFLLGSKLTQGSDRNIIVGQRWL